MISSDNTVEKTTIQEMHRVQIAEVQDTTKDITANIIMAMVTENLSYKRQKMDYHAIGANNLDI